MTTVRNRRAAYGVTCPVNKASLISPFIPPLSWEDSSPQLGRRKMGEAEQKFDTLALPSLTKILVFFNFLATLN